MSKYNHDNKCNCGCKKTNQETYSKGGCGCGCDSCGKRSHDKGCKCGCDCCK